MNLDDRNGRTGGVAIVRGLGLLIALLLAIVPLLAYPLDARQSSGIRRLDGYLKAQSGSGAKLSPGALLPAEAIELTLVEANPTWDLNETPHDPVLQSALESIFKGRDPSYAVTVIDISDPGAIVWAGLRDTTSQSPGSVNKVLCMVALFDGLQRAFPKIEDRQRVLRETMVVATDWVLVDEHAVPHFVEETGTNRFGIIRPGDRFYLAEWIDHMISPSANAAGATVWKEAMLLRHFGSAYPPTAEQETAFFRDTPRLELQKLSQQVINEPLIAAGIDTSRIQQGSMWTRTGKSRIPGLPSYATPHELARLLLRIEQGRAVDAWSSLEMKRYLYMTRKRYRYVYAPELAEAAVYFKSGSLYQCAPEEDFRCGKYRGNRKNYMNSVAIVESPAARGPEQRRYIVALMSNVLRVNSAWDHSRYAAAIEKVVRTRQPAAVRENATEAEQNAAGRGE